MSKCLIFRSCLLAQHLRIEVVRGAGGREVGDELAKWTCSSHAGCSHWPPQTPKLLRGWLLPVLTVKSEVVIRRSDGGVG